MVSFLLLLISLSASATEIQCEAWHQAPGQVLERLPIPITQQTESGTTYSLDSKGYQFKAEWHKSLTTFYISIGSAGKIILSTTARVPTADHPENFTDLHLPTGPRLSMSCEMK